MQFGIALYDALVGANIPASKALPLVQAMDKELIERLASKEQLLAVELRLGQRTSAIAEKLTLISQRSKQRIRAHLRLRSAASKTARRSRHCRTAGRPAAPADLQEVLSHKQRLDRALVLHSAHRYGE